MECLLQYNDVKLRINGILYPSSRFVLANKSSYFRRILDIDLEILDIDLPSQAFIHVLQYIHGQHFNLQDYNIRCLPDFLLVATECELHELENEIINNIQSRISTDSVWDIFNAGCIDGNYSLIKIAWNFIQENLQVISHYGFSTLHECAIARIISDEKFLRNNRQQIIRAMVQWDEVYRTNHPREIDNPLFERFTIIVTDLSINDTDSPIVMGGTVLDCKVIRGRQYGYKICDNAGEIVWRLEEDIYLLDQIEVNIIENCDHCLETSVNGIDYVEWKCTGLNERECYQRDQGIFAKYIRIRGSPLVVDNTSLVAKQGKGK